MIRAHDFSKCANTRYSPVTASCHNSTLPTPSSDGGLVIGALNISCFKKESQVTCQKSAFESSRVLDSTSIQLRLILKVELYVLGRKDGLPRYWKGFRGYVFFKYSFFIEAMTLLNLAFTQLDYAYAYSRERSTMSY